MIVTDEGIVIYFNDLHWPNVDSGIKFTEDGIIISVNDEYMKEFFGNISIEGGNAIIFNCLFISK